MKFLYIVEISFFLMSPFIFTKHLFEFPMPAQ